jgi:CO/xanthine dehydrogenase FAD-binding subunit
MVALKSTLVVSGQSGTREIPAEEFFVGLFTTAVQTGELLTEIRIPRLPSRSGYAFQEMSRRHGDFALVGAAAVVVLDENGRCDEARVALLSVGDRPVLAVHAANALKGQTPSAESIRAAAQLAATRDIDPPSDIHASARYRRQLANVLTRRTLERAFERARQG